MQEETCSFGLLGQGIFRYTRPLGEFGPAVSSVLFLGEDRAIVVDTMCGPGDMALFSRIVGERRVHVILTHGDWDHCLGTGAFCDPVVIAHERTKGRLLAPSLPGLEEVKVKRPDLVEGAATVLPHITFGESVSLSLGQRDILVRHLPGHTGDSSVCWDPETRILVAGDAVENPIPSIGDPTSLDAWIAGLTSWASLARTVVPGHGAPGGPELIWQNVKYLELVRSLAEIGRKAGAIPEKVASENPLEMVFPEAEASLSTMRPRDAQFYKEVHKENLMRVMALYP